jgi:hypothetical protein
MASPVKVKPGFKLAELDLERRLADEASYQRKLRKSQIRDARTRGNLPG